MSVFPVKEKTKKEKMSRESAFEIIEKWVDETRTRVYGDDLEDLQNLLYMSVIDERLIMDESEKRKFILKLEEPIVKQGGGDPISIIHISKVPQSAIFKLEKYKTESAKAENMIQTFCKDSEGADIAIGFIGRIDPRDSSTIQAVISAFFF